MVHVPVSFTHDNIRYSGTLKEISGAAAKTWHLMIDNYYYGPLLFVNDKFVFYPQVEKYKWMQDLAGYFGEVVTLWYR